MRKIVVGVAVVVAAVALFAAGAWFPSSSIADGWRERSQRQASERFEEQCEAIPGASMEGEKIGSMLLGAKEVCSWAYPLPSAGKDSGQYTDANLDAKREFLHFCADVEDAVLTDPATAWPPSWPIPDSGIGVWWCVRYAPVEDYSYTVEDRWNRWRHLRSSSACSHSLSC